MEIIEHYFSEFTHTQKEQFTALGPLYTQWNAQINVVSRKDMDALYEKHVLHSLAIAALFSFNAGARILDIGTGGGFPGIPLALFFPEVEFVLVDSIGKKIKVVKEVAKALRLQNVTAYHSRAEDLHDGPFDFAVSRAVAPLGQLWQWAQPHLRVGHKSEQRGNGLICLKGGNLKEEFAQSGVKPRAFPIPQLFPEAAFEDKVVVYVPR